MSASKMQIKGTPRPPGQGRKGSKVRRALRRRDGDNCWWCGELMDFEAPSGRTPLSATRGHIIELGRGGKNTMDNQRLAHARCNNTRSARFPGGTPRKHVILRLRIGSLEVVVVTRKTRPRRLAA